MKQNPTWVKKHAIDMLKNQELPPLSDRLHKGMGQKLLLWWINHRKSILPKDRRIGLAITELCSQKQVFIENAQSRYSNRTVTLIEHSSEML